MSSGVKAPSQQIINEKRLISGLVRGVKKVSGSSDNREVSDQFLTVDGNFGIPRELESLLLQEYFQFASPLRIMRSGPARLLRQVKFRTARYRGRE